jgi:hypothetical protein
MDREVRAVSDPEKKPESTKSTSKIMSSETAMGHNSIYIKASSVEFIGF